MNEVSRILIAVENGNEQAASRLLPLVYDELRMLATQRMARENPGQTLTATALVHDAYLRLIEPGNRKEWAGRGQFFAAAAEAMRRILIDRARKKKSGKHGGQRNRINLDDITLGVDSQGDDILEIDNAICELEVHDRQTADLVVLRFFGGLGHQEAADALGISRRQADRLWVVARAWLFDRLSDGD
jgi:RNA polymerase sigma factor (TIGR02999 family)